MMFHQKTVPEVIKEFDTDSATGLTVNQAVKRLAKYGPNILPSKKKPSVIFKLIEQFKNVLVIILLFATVISFLLGEILDAIAIAIIVLINATIGFIQEVQAEKTLESLKEKEVFYALVQREDNIEKVPFEKIVPGDILILEEGAKIPADGRIVESFSLHVDESILTGESLPSAKNPKELSLSSLALADRVNMIYKDTQVTSGRGKAVVVATGGATEIGKIALFLEEATAGKTPLTVELEKVGKMLTVIVLIIAGLIFLLSLVGQTSMIESLLISISLAVAAIPEGLPAIVTIVLSLGVKRLAGKKALVKKLPAVETLGAIHIIATDKTGTITQNKINVVKIILPDTEAFTIEGEGYKPEGTFFVANKEIVDPRNFPQLEELLKTAVLSSNATFASDTKNGVIGDTTEAALIVAAARAKFDISEIRSAEAKIYEVPFSSERKMMSVVVQINETKDHFLYSKGAPEVILERCKLTPEKKKQFIFLVQKMAEQGLRSLALARRKLKIVEVKKALEEDILNEESLEFLGLAGMQDPLRPEVKEAIEAAKLAGIRTIMITGDHKETAATIAQEAGIIGDKDTSDGDEATTSAPPRWRNQTILTEEEVIKMSQKELTAAIKQGVNVFARISPMGKLRIIEAIKTIPHTQVAVTGDGVNDAPALKASHIGLAMGLTGTDITREVADIVITDDNYATIVDAIREGRIIFANLVKFIRYLISCNLSEVIVVAAAVFMKMPLALMPIQLLWINLITDGLPALALGVDPPEFDVMKRPPRDLSEGILHKKRWMYMLIEGGIMGVTVFSLFAFALNNYSYRQAQTMAFTALALSQLVHAFNNRSTRKSLFQLGVFGNKILVLAVLFSVGLQIMAVQTLWGNFIFKTQPLSSYHWLLVISVSLIPFVIVEAKKQLRFRILP